MGEVTVNTMRVEELMLKHGIPSRARLARRADLSEGTLLATLNGLRNPSMETVTKLANALECHPYDILTTTGFPDPHFAAPASLSLAA